MFNLFTRFFKKEDKMARSGKPGMVFIFNKGKKEIIFTFKNKKDRQAKLVEYFSIFAIHHCYTQLDDENTYFIIDRKDYIDKHKNLFDLY